MQMALRVYDFPERARGRVVVKRIPTTLVVAKLSQAQQGNVDLVFGHGGQALTRTLPAKLW
jgi:hypothetical protein